MLNSSLGETRPEHEWSNGAEFSGILGQPREIHSKFRNEVPENVCSIRSQTRNFLNLESAPNKMGKSPTSFPGSSLYLEKVLEYAEVV